MSRLRTRIAREESGFTLIELMVSAVIGVVIVGVAFALLDSSVRAFGSSEARTDAAQRGRLALDVVTQQLRSPVCISPAPNDAAFVSASPTAVKFMSDLSGGVRPPVERELIYSAGTLTEKERDVATGTVRTRELITGIAPVDTSTPVFSYFALTPISSSGRSATVSLGAGGTVLADDLKRITRIHVAFKVVPRNADDSKSAADFVSDVYVRAIDASSEAGTINCVGAS